MRDPPPVAMPAPSVHALRDRLSSIVRAAGDASEESEALPLAVSPRCVQPGCERDGSLVMVTCDICNGALHRSCGATTDDDDEECEPGHRCTTCATRSGKRKHAG
ncbi:unnamed protein product [Pylaiella littoralis]